MAILDDNEFVEVEGRGYLNPQIALDESNQFIDNLRSTQQANNQQIKTDTYNLGTSVPSNLGGLTGGEGYFTSRYQVPQTNSVVADLRSAAQASALNQVLANEQDIWKKRYNDAYRSYQKRSGGGSGSNGGSGGNGGNSSGWQGDTTLKATDGGGGGNGSTDGGGGGGGSTDTTKTNTPPNPDEYYIDGDEQTQKIKERSGWMPEWLINALKIVG